MKLKSLFFKDRKLLNMALTLSPARQICSNLQKFCGILQEGRRELHADNFHKFHVTLFARLPTCFLTFVSLKRMSSTTHREGNSPQTCNTCSASAVPFQSGDVLAFYSKYQISSSILHSQASLLLLARGSFAEEHALTLPNGNEIQYKNSPQNHSRWKGRILFLN